MPRAGRHFAYYLIAPAVLILAVTSLYPAVYSFVLSFYNWNWGVQFDFVGLRNYLDLFKSAEFWQVLYQTFLFAVVATLLELFLAWRWRWWSTGSSSVKASFVHCCSRR